MVFDCFGCISLGIKENFSVYLDNVMKVVFLAFEGSIKLSQSSNEADLEYSESLRDKLIECLTCFAHSF